MKSAQFGVCHFVQCSYNCLFGALKKRRIVAHCLSCVAYSPPRELVLELFPRGSAEAKRPVWGGATVRRDACSGEESGDWGALARLPARLPARSSVRLFTRPFVRLFTRPFVRSLAHVTAARSNRIVSASGVWPSACSPGASAWPSSWRKPPALFSPAPHFRFSP